VTIREDADPSLYAFLQKFHEQRRADRIRLLAEQGLLVMNNGGLISTAQPPQTAGGNNVTHQPTGQFHPKSPQSTHFESAKPPTDGNSGSSALEDDLGDLFQTS
jgi:hypothetical protein